jgi:small-conductance mechanosensitive channel
MNFLMNNFNLSSTLLLLLCTFVLKTLNTKLLTNRYWRIVIKNLLNLLLLVGLFVIWTNEIKSFGISIIAIAAAVAIATKEFILCFVGGVYKAINKLFKVGDRIEVNENLGDVIDNNLIFTKLMEVGPKGLSQQYTGRIISVPNSLFLTSSVHNLTSSKKYGFHVFCHPVTYSENILLDKKLMYYAALETCETYLDDAQMEMQNAALKECLDAPKVKPVISLYFKSANEVDFVIRVPVPVRMRGHYQQKIIHRYLEKKGLPRNSAKTSELDMVLNRSINLKN